MALTLFYITSAVAVFATVMMITRLNAVHGLLYLILSLLAVGVLFFLLGAHFAAVLEVIIYAGAIMVLFVFVIMMLNQGQKTIEQERAWLQPGIWIGPSLLALILFVEMLVIVVLWRQRRNRPRSERQAGGDRIIRTLSAGCGTGLDAVAGRIGRRLSPGKTDAQDNKNRGESHERDSDGTWPVAVCRAVCAGANRGIGSA